LKKDVWLPNSGNIIFFHIKSQYLQQYKYLDGSVVEGETKLHN